VVWVIINLTIWPTRTAFIVMVLEVQLHQPRTHKYQLVEIMELTNLFRHQDKASSNIINYKVILRMHLQLTQIFCISNNYNGKLKHKWMSIPKLNLLDSHRIQEIHKDCRINWIINVPSKWAVEVKRDSKCINRDNTIANNIGLRNRGSISKLRMRCWSRIVLPPHKIMYQT